MVAEVEQAQKDGDTLGGVVEVVVWGLPPGLGSHVHWDRRLDAQLAGALMGIQAIKGVEVGDGFELARSRGSAAHDEIVPGEQGIARASHRSGGTEGGMSTGEVLRVRAAMKPNIDGAARLAYRRRRHGRGGRRPSPALGRLRRTGGRGDRRGDGRLVLANAALEKFGGDSVAKPGATTRAISSRWRIADFRCGPSHEHPARVHTELSTDRPSCRCTRLRQEHCRSHARRTARRCLPRCRRWCRAGRKVDC